MNNIGENIDSHYAVRTYVMWAFQGKCFPDFLCDAAVAAHVAGWEPYSTHDLLENMFFLSRICTVNRSCTAPQNGR